MKNNYYLLEVEGGVEPTVHGPYHTKHERDNAAKQIRQRQKEDDGLFWADIDEALALAVGTYTAGFFWQEPREDFNQENKGRKIRKIRDVGKNKK